MSVAQVTRRQKCPAANFGFRVAEGLVRLVGGGDLHATGIVRPANVPVTEARVGPFGPYSEPRLARGFFIVPPAMFHCDAREPYNARVPGCGCSSRSVSMGARVPAEINPALAAANRRRRHVGYPPKSRYDAALPQVKSWAMCGRLRVGKCFLHACRSGVAAMCSAC